MTPESEHDLLMLAQRGDEHAYTRLVEQHQQAVFRLAYLLLGDARDADDVAQETFIRAFRALNRFDMTRPLRPWLLSITSNLARNRWRSISRYLAMVKRVAHSENERALRHDDSQQAEAKALREAVARLERADQEVIYLRFFLELSVEESAEVLKVAPGTVKSRLHRALKRLRAVVSQEFPILYEGYADE